VAALNVPLEVPLKLALEGTGTDTEKNASPKVKVCKTGAGLLLKMEHEASTEHSASVHVADKTPLL
jgi:hypothetical protein